MIKKQKRCMKTDGWITFLQDPGWTCILKTANLCYTSMFSYSFNQTQRESTINSWCGPPIYCVHVYATWKHCELDYWSQMFYTSSLQRVTKTSLKGLSVGFHPHYPGMELAWLTRTPWTCLSTIVSLTQLESHDEAEMSFSPMRKAAMFL